MPITPQSQEKLLSAVQNRDPVSGLTHCFYRYPARFSPHLARAAIEAFSEPGDTVLDPFCGGGTSLVEAASLGRRGVGTDISSLAVFVSRVKTRVLLPEQLSNIRDWSIKLRSNWSLRNSAPHDGTIRDPAYVRNLHSTSTWRIRRLLEIALGNADALACEAERDFVRCALLRTAQWALDNKKTVPAAEEFRGRFFINLEEMILGARAFAESAQYSSSTYGQYHPPSCVQTSAIGLESQLLLEKPPSLVLTSPPYPGVHVLYHRWQVKGRRETPAPFWIAGEVDGNGASFYTMGGRHQTHLPRYFGQIRDAFTSIAMVIDSRTTVVQAVAFSSPEWQLERYLQVMAAVGFREVIHEELACSDDGRLWRDVPNRKWYANQRGATGGSREVVLFHRLNDQGNPQ